MRLNTLHAMMIVVALSSPAAMGASPAPAQTPKPPTADQQSQSKSDLKITQQIRRAVVKDKTLSMMAHNCKIITQQGLVTLRGEVKSEAERTTIGDIAGTVAGADKVTNQLVLKVKK